MSKTVLFIRLRKDLVDAARSGDFSAPDLKAVSDVFSKRSLKMKPSQVVQGHEYEGEFFAGVERKVGEEIVRELKACKGVVHWEMM